MQQLNKWNISIILLIGILIGVIIGINYAMNTCIEVGTHVLNIELKPEFYNRFSSFISYVQQNATKLHN